MPGRGALQGVTVSTAFFVAPPAVAEIVEVEEVATGTVETLKPAVVALAETDTDAGTVATAVFELFKVTVNPPDGAGPVKVTVAFELLPPVTVVGLRASESTAGAFTMSVSVFVTPL